MLPQAFAHRRPGQGQPIPLGDQHVGELAAPGHEGREIGRLGVG